jgi:adenosylcobinamide-GDP ribazoletransferase
MLPPSLRGFRAAFVFLTRLPVGGFPYGAADHAWAPAYFPLVGFSVGLLSALPIVLTERLGALVTALCVLFFSTYLTGAFHEDGLADSADALFGAHGPKRIFEILKDSRIGTYGASALVFSFSLRAACLASLLGGELRPGAFRGHEALLCWPWVSTLARLGPIWLMAFLPYVSPEGAKGSQVAKGGGAAQVAVATLSTALITLGVFWLGVSPARVFAAALLLVIVTWWTGRRYQRATGGFTGDFLGATEQLLEVGMLVMLTLTREAH